MGRILHLWRRELHWRAGVATLLLGVVLVLEILGAAALIRSPYSGLVPWHDRVVGRVAPGSPAAEAGFRKGDVLLTLPPRSPAPQVGDHVSYRVSRDGEEFSLSLTYAPLPHREALRKVSFGLVAVAFFLVAYIVYARREDATGLVFGLFCLDVGVLLMNRPGWLLSRWPLGDKLASDAATLMLAPIVLHLFLLFPERHQLARRFPWLVRLIYLPALAGILITIPLNARLLRTGELPGSGVILFERVITLYLLAAFVGGVALFVRSFRRTADAAMQRRLKGVVVGTVCGLLPMGIVAALLNAFPGMEIPGDRLAPLALALIPISFGHAIVRYGLFDVEIFLKRGAVYGILSAALLGVYLALVTGLGRLVETRTPPGSRTALTLVAILVMAAIFSPLRQRVERWVDRTFYREKYSYRRTLRALSHDLARMMDLDRILDLLAARVEETLHPERLALFLYDTAQGDFLAVRARGAAAGEAGLVFRGGDEVPRRLAQEGEPLALERLPAGESLQNLPPREQRVLARAGAAVLVPFISEGKMVAFLALGPKRSQEHMSAEDVELLGTLADHAATSLQNARLHQEALAREKMERELAVARAVQQTLLPSGSPSLEGLDVAGASTLSAEIGGDLYDYVRLGPDRLAVVIGDAMGKGVPAALLMASLQATVRGEAETRSGPEAVVTAANRRLCQRSDETRFASLVYGEIDLARGLFTYVNAGHPPPLLLTPEGHVRSLEMGGLLLGLEPDAPYQEGAETLSPGSAIVLYTDGVVDEAGSGEEPFGRERLEEILRRSRDLPSHELTREVLRAVKAHGGAVLGDDATLVVIRNTRGGAT